MAIARVRSPTGIPPAPLPRLSVSSLRQPPPYHRQAAKARAFGRGSPSWIASSRPIGAAHVPQTAVAKRRAIPVADRVMSAGTRSRPALRNPSRPPPQIPQTTGTAGGSATAPRLHRRQRLLHRQPLLHTIALQAAASGRLTLEAPIGTPRSMTPVRPAVPVPSRPAIHLTFAKSTFPRVRDKPPPLPRLRRPLLRQ